MPDYPDVILKTPHSADCWAKKKFPDDPWTLGFKVVRDWHNNNQHIRLSCGDSACGGQILIREDALLQWAQEKLEGK
jgi:hypothetical protein